MKLNTKDLFESRMTSKINMKKPKKSTLTSPLKKNKTSNNKLSKNTNSKNPKSFHNTNKSVNPFIQISEKNNDLKHIKKEKIPIKKNIF